MAVSFVNCFSVRGKGRDGYVNAIFEPETLSDSGGDDDEEAKRLACDRDVALNTFDSSGFEGYVYKPEADGPFSHITPSMWPIDVIAAFSQPEDSHPAFRVNAYGFVVDEVPDDCPQLQGSDSRERSALTQVDLRTRWLDFLELTYNTEARPRMLWSHVEKQLRHCRSLDDLIEQGLPNSMRAQLWLRFCRGLTLSAKHQYSYSEMVEKSKVQATSDVPVTRILPNNACFMNASSVGSTRLVRILRVLRWCERRNRYFEGQDSVNIGLIAAHLLLICEEEEVFWLCLSIISELKRWDFNAILKSCIATTCPEIDQLLKSNDIEIILIAGHWFSSLFATLLTDVSLLFRFWDYYFYHGPGILFQVLIGILDYKKAALTEVGRDSAALFNHLENLPCEVTDLSTLRKHWQTGQRLLPMIPNSVRHMSDASYSSETLDRRKSAGDVHDIRDKNIVQTSILIELHDAIVAIGQHFETFDPHLKANFSLDLSENPTEVSVNRPFNEKKEEKKKRLAKAVVDFQRNDSDELAFRKGDIICVLSEKDEHCWIGEMNGLTGWFPAQFVLPLHSTGDDYAVAGDDRVVMFINDLVRGRLCHVLKQVLSHGLRRSKFVAVHSWTVIQAIASACVQTDFSSVYAKLMLTKTYRLEDLTRVLTPCEILYKNISLINQTHADQPMDIRLRSLICLSLNQKMLSSFLTVVCETQPDLLEKYYYEWGYIRSPVWRLIRAELRILTQFSFNLNPCAELETGDTGSISRDGVQDMLLTHHLFSWGI